MSESGSAAIDGVIERSEGHALVLTLSNPGRRNAFTPEMRRRLAVRIAAAYSDDEIRTIILTGEGEHFCAGADLSRVGGGDRPGPLQFRENQKDAQTLVRTIAGGSKPVIAAVEGVAVGGGLSIALACDFVVAASNARFGVAFSKLGLMPDLGLLYTLAARIGRPAARRMIMTSDTFDGAKAVEAGIADELVEPGKALTRALDLAASLETAAPLALGMVKVAFSGRIETLDDALRLELDLMPALVSSADFAEGVQAFKEAAAALQGTLIMGPLAGIRVLDLSRILAAPWASQMLGDLGADVIKVEMPGTGDDSRIYGPVWLPQADGKPSKNSSFFICANRNKRSITVDFSKEEGKQVIRDLVRKSDVLIENFIAGAMSRAELDYASMRKINPRIVYCSVTGYGQSGPYAMRPGYDAVFQAQSGLMSVTGNPDDSPGGGPMRIGPSLVDVSTGYNAAIAILAALLERDRSGRGQHIDVALLDVAVAIQSHLVQGYLMNGKLPGRHGTVGNGGQPARVFTCEDGTVYISAGTKRQHDSLCEVLGVPELTKDPRFATSPLRFDNREAWSAVADPIVAKWAKVDLYEALVAAKVPCSVINDYAEVFDDAQVRHRGLKINVPHPQAGDRGIDMVANPLHFSETPVGAYATPPFLGQHTDEILSELAGYSAEKIDALRRQGAI